jgi:hypothetical protein
MLQRTLRFRMTFPPRRPPPSRSASASLKNGTGDVRAVVERVSLRLRLFSAAPLALRENFKFNRVLHEHLVIVVPHDCQPGIRGIAYPWGQSSTPLPSPAPHVRHLRALGTSSLAASRLSTKHSVKLVRATARSSRASVSRRLPRKADEFKDTRQLSKNAKAAVPAVKCSGEYGAFRRDDRRSAIRSSRW